MIFVLTRLEYKVFSLEKRHFRVQILVPILALSLKHALSGTKIMDEFCNPESVKTLVSGSRN